MRTAVVHDWLNGMRGGEKVLEAILPLVPNPTIFTLFHVPGSVSAGIESHPIRTSYLNRLPLARRHYRHYLPLFPAAVEAFDLSGFDLVVSSSHCVAKGAIAAPGVPHLCYCHTPVRYAYEQFDLYFPAGRTRFRALKAAAIGRLRRWDVATASRPSQYLANSSAVAERIARHYGRQASICHPPVDIEFFRPADQPAPRGDFLLAVGALVPYKRLEVAIEAARNLGRRLVLVGRGPEHARLSALAEGAAEIRASLGAAELRELYRTCSAYVQPGEEDFGIAAVEALACGAPVVALGRGGARDIVEDGVNGALSDEDGPDALAEAVRRADRARFDYTRLRASALPFGQERFAVAFRGALGELVR
ncbi:MAG TPA: glycosyltransferase [Thermoanaerobaculia bacterium]|jgi:glycosyltransferase involved in cell wall biosynthesis|nr:glycosyltransferase [Thermoanaerobaculia bacterium]